MLAARTWAWGRPCVARRTRALWRPMTWSTAGLSPPAPATVTQSPTLSGTRGSRHVRLCPVPVRTMTETRSTRHTRPATVDGGAARSEAASASST